MHIEWDKLCSAKEMEEALDKEIEKNRLHSFCIRLMDAKGKPRPKVRIEAVHKRHDFTFGVCPNGHISMTNRLACGEGPEAETYWDRIGEVFNGATLWWGWRVLEPERGVHTFDRECAGFGPMERMIERAEERGMRLTAHALLYPRDDVSPGWLAGCTEREACRALEEHVKATAKRYRGRITCWHPVNEAYDKIQRTGGLRVNEGLVYRWVKDAAPGSCIVDNGGRTIDPDFYEKGICSAELFGGRVDDLGVRGYFELYDSDAVPFYRSMWEHFTDLERRYRRGVRVTEIGASSARRKGEYSPWDVDPTTTEQLGITNMEDYRASRPITEETQAEFLTRMYRLAFAHPAVKECTYWDLCDSYTWNETEGGLLRPDLSCKPAYKQLQELIQKKWRTEAVSVSDREGVCRFNGYDGEYEIRIGDRVYPAHLNSEEPEERICII